MSTAGEHDPTVDDASPSMAAQAWLVAELGPEAERTPPMVWLTGSRPHSLDEEWVVLVERDKASPSDPSPGIFFLMRHDDERGGWLVEEAKRVDDAWAFDKSLGFGVEGWITGPDAER